MESSGKQAFHLGLGRRRGAAAGGGDNMDTGVCGGLQDMWKEEEDAVFEFLFLNF